jgi:hypothetical protein
LLVVGRLDVAVLDLATFLGERVLGWDGVAVAMLGPAKDDREVGVVAVEHGTWTRRRDLCERLTRGGVRTLERLAAGSLGDGPDVSGWWPDGRPSAREVAAVARWSSGPTPRALREGLAWTRPGEGARVIGRVTSSDPRR